MFRLSRSATAYFFALFLMAAMPAGSALAHQLTPVGCMLSRCLTPVDHAPTKQFQVQTESPTVPVLQFRTYGDNWLRFYNAGENNALKLAVDGISQFRFRFVRSNFPLGLAELEGAAIEGLSEKYDLEYDETRIDGYCGSTFLYPKSTDVLCVPGPCDMPEGYVFLVMYHPDNNAIVALTTIVNNIAGGARIGSCSGAQAVSEDIDNAKFNGIEHPGWRAARENQTHGCGPYSAGQWIKQADYAASGLSLPIVPHELAGHVITDYQCIMPDDGGAPYLRAYTIFTSPPSKKQESRKSNRKGAPLQANCSCQASYQGQPLLTGRIVTDSVVHFCDCCYGDGSVGYAYVFEP